MNFVINDDLITKCMHCGLCLPTCPTYALTGLEKSSPRGRIRLMKSVADGEMEPTAGFVEEMEFCLDCQACETACPAGVEYGSLVETTRNEIDRQKKTPWIIRYSRSMLLGRLFGSKSLFNLIARLMRWSQKLWSWSFSGRASLAWMVPKHLTELQQLVPQISLVPSSKTLQQTILPSGESRYKVGFLTGCIMDVAFADINHDTVKLLSHHGCTVYVPGSQGCCGSLQAHNGGLETARAFARRNIDAFGSLDLDAIIMNSAGCGAFMKEYGEVLKDDPEYAVRAANLAGKVKDLSEFLAEIGLKLDGGEPYKGKRVTYHDACHLVHSQKISQEPRQLIKSVAKADYIELPESTWCCGSAGIYNITHYESSMQLLDRKIANVKKIRPDVIVTGNPGCLIQLQYGLKKEGLTVELLHLATFLRRACCE